MFDLRLAYTQRLARALHEMSGDGFTCADENGTLRALMDDKNIAYLDENRVTRAQLYADGFFLSDENGNVVWRSPER